MTGRPRLVSGVRDALAIVLLLTFTVTVQAQIVIQGQLNGAVVEVREVQDPAAAHDDDDDEEEVVQPRIEAFTLSDDQFDQWIFGVSRNAGGGRNKLDSLLTLQVEEVAKSCHLADVQKQKLLLAGRGDIKRFLDQVEVKRKVFDANKKDQNKISEIYQELAPLRLALNNGIFGNNSLYSKTLNRLLDEGESARYQQLIDAKRRFRFRAKVDLVVAQFDQMAGFRDDQRKAFTTLIMNEVEPIAQYGEYDSYLLMYKVGTIPPTKIKAIMNDRQWSLLSRQLQQAKGMEQFLRGQGLLPEKDEIREIANEFAKAMREPRREDKPQPHAADLPGEVFTNDGETNQAAEDREP